MTAEQEKQLKAEMRKAFAPADKIGGFYSDIIFEKLMEHRRDYRKSLADFGYDRSRYEFAYMAFVNRNLKGLLKVDIIKKDYTYTDGEKALLIALVAKQTLPYRPKHAEKRDGLIWLLYLAREVVISDRIWELEKAEEVKQKKARKTEKMKKYFYEDIETGELFTLEEAKKTARERYDIGDETNMLTFSDKFRKTDIEDTSEKVAAEIRKNIKNPFDEAEQN